jgi:hypothetical protein
MFACNMHPYIRTPYLGGVLAKGRGLCEGVVQARHNHRHTVPRGELLQLGHKGGAGFAPGRGEENGHRLATAHVPQLIALQGTPVQPHATVTALGDIGVEDLDCVHPVSNTKGLWAGTTHAKQCSECRSFFSLHDPDR